MPADVCDLQNMYRDMREAWNKATTSLTEPEFPTPTDKASADKGTAKSDDSTKGKSPSKADDGSAKGKSAAKADDGSTKGKGKSMSTSVSRTSSAELPPVLPGDEVPRSPSGMKSPTSRCMFVLILTYVDIELV